MFLKWYFVPKGFFKTVKLILRRLALIGKMTSVRTLIFVASAPQGPMFQMNIKNAELNIDSSQK